jgi:metal-sulfur cluster biosynthetic enzyme
MQSSGRQLDNSAPLIHHGSAAGAVRSADDLLRAADPDAADPVDALEVYDLLKAIRDPEHPNTLEQLRVVNVEHITVDEAARRVRVQFTPTVPHCSMTTLIGLCILVKLQRTLPADFRVKVLVTPGSHEQEVQVNKQLGDKERVAAALESKALVNAVDSCLRGVN